MATVATVATDEAHAHAASAVVVPLRAAVEALHLVEAKGARHT